MAKKGFTLIELSIVLVIIGLIVGGVLVGRDLIRAAEVRAVATEYQQFITATNTFKEKYAGLPGDITNATTYWGKDNANCTAQVGTAATPGTCNGNADGVIPAGTAEQHRYWQQLGLARLTAGSYSGVAGAGGAFHCVIGVGCPSSRFANAGWGIDNLGSYAGDSAWYAADYNNLLVVGAQHSAEYPSIAVMKPVDALSIDTKLDDGKPGTGRVLAVRWSTCTNSSAYTDKAGTYLTSSSNVACALAFTNVF